MAIRNRPMAVFNNEKTPLYEKLSNAALLVFIGTTIYYMMILVTNV